MRICKFFILILLMCAARSVGQTESKELADTEALLTNGRYAAALPLLLKQLKKDSLDGNLNLKIGICYLNSRSQKAKAVYFLNKAIASTNSNDKENSKKNTEKPIIKIDLQIKAADKNSNASDVGYSAILSSEQSALFFTALKPGNKKGGSIKDDAFFENTPIAKLAKKVDTIHTHLDSVKAGKIDISAIKRPIDTLIGKEATVMTSEDNQVIITYKDTKGDGNLYISILNANQWTIPEKLNKIVNTRGWETNECISADGNWLYFTSDREGGFGGLDIYKCKKLLNGEWSKAVNLGPVINSPFNERAPFTLYEGTTLYFSSNRNKENLIYDIFTSTLSEGGNWLEPVNVGYPSNGIDESTYPVTAGINKTDTLLKPAGQVEKDNCMFTFINKKEAEFSVMRGNITDQYGAFSKFIKITVTDNETEDIIGIYNLNSETGQYLFILPPGRNNNITYESPGYLFQSENINMSKEIKYYEIRKSIQMLPISIGSKVVLNNVFFNRGQAAILPASKVELNRILSLLTLNPALTVEISGYMISKENAKNNKIISLQRAQAVAEFLYGEGISVGRISAKGYIKKKANKSDKKLKKSVASKNTQIDEWIELNIIEKK